MSLQNRVSIYKKIESLRRRPLLVYVTSKREGVHAEMSSDALPYVIEQLEALPPNTRRLDLLISSFGGDPMTAWRIMSLIRQRVRSVSVLIPQSAYSAATLLALGADSIVMHPNGHLGPVDMQVSISSAFGGRRNFSTEVIIAFLDFVRESLKITDQEHIRALFDSVCKEIGPLGIGFSVRSAKLSVDLGERLLALHMKDDDSRSKLRALVENMSRQFQSHSYPINRTEAIDIGLKISNRNKNLEGLMWEVWLDLEEEMKERTPFDPVLELLASSQASKLLSPVPQLGLPYNAPSPNYSADIDKITAKSVDIDPVDFEVETGLIESARTNHACTVKGKILSCRTPDLMIQYNAVMTFKGWLKQSVGATQ